MQEIDTIQTWIDGDMTEGEARTIERPNPPRLEDGTDYSTPDFIPEIVGGDLAEFDEYRCFRIDPNIDTTQCITGYDVLLENNALIHHVFAFIVDPDAGIPIERW